MTESYYTTDKLSQQCLKTALDSRDMQIPKIPSC